MPNQPTLTEEDKALIGEGRKTEERLNALSRMTDSAAAHDARVVHGLIDRLEPLLSAAPTPGREWTDADVERAARAICKAWDYEWDGDPDRDDQVAPDTSDGERPSKALYREAARAVLFGIRQPGDGGSNG